MLISVIAIIISEIENIRFSQDLILSIEKVVQTRIEKEDKIISFNEMFKIKKNEFIIEKLINKASGYEIKLNTIEENKKLLKNNLSNEKELNFIFSEEIANNLKNENFISNLIEKLKLLYEKRINFKHFDERIFLMNNNSSYCSPIKMTPFKRQKIVGDFEIKKPSAFKTLNFNNINNIGNEGIFISSNNFNNSIMNFYNLDQSAEKYSPGVSLGYQFRDNQINTNSLNTATMTPCSKVFAMSRWVNDYTKEWRNENLFELFSSENLQNLSVPEELENLPNYQLKTQNQPGPNFTNLCRDYLKNSNTTPKIKNFGESISDSVLEYLQSIEKLIMNYQVRILYKIEDMQKLIFKIIFGLLRRDMKKFKKEFVSKLLINVNFLKSAIILGVEIVLFIENVEVISFYKLAEILDLDLYEFWKIINPFLKFDLTVPSDILYHFQELDVQLISFMIWRKPSMNFKREASEYLMNSFSYLSDKEIKEIEDLEFHNQSLFLYHDMPSESDLEKISQDSKKEDSSSSVENLYLTNLKPYKNISSIYIFLRRVLNYSIYLNKKICDNMNLNRELAKEVEFLIKRLLTNSSYFNVLYSKHIDLIIICCIISILKYRNFYEQKNINNILDAYKKSKNDESEGLMKSLFHSIKLNNNSNTIGILELFENHFICLVNKLVEDSMNELDDEVQQQIKLRRKKMSLPDEEILTTQFEDESAFKKDIRIYDSFKNTVFAPEGGNYFNHMSMGSKLSQTYSARCSPLISRSMGVSPAINRTPRTSSLRTSFNDYPLNNAPNSSVGTPVIVQRTNSNKFKNILRNQMQNSSGKLKLNEKNNIQYSQNLSFGNSQGTPEFNRHQN